MVLFFHSLVYKSLTNAPYRVDKIQISLWDFFRGDLSGPCHLINFILGHKNGARTTVAACVPTLVWFLFLLKKKIKLFVLLGVVFQSVF